MIGIFDLLERMAGMAGLSAGLALPFLSQAFRRWFPKAIGRRRLATVARVLGDLLFQCLHPIAQRLAFGAQGGILGFQEGEIVRDQIHFAGQLQKYAHDGFFSHLVDDSGLLACQHLPALPSVREQAGAHNSRRNSGMNA